MEGRWTNKSLLENQGSLRFESQLRLSIEKIKQFFYTNLTPTVKATGIGLKGRLSGGIFKLKTEHNIILIHKSMGA